MQEKEILKQESMDELEEPDLGLKDTSEELSQKNLPLITKQNKPVTPDALTIYLREISKFPILTPEEEVELAKRVKKYKDKEAAFKLITSNLRLVVKIALEFQKKWMTNVLELIQEGNVGLMKAVQKFDPDKGIKFSYYASFWIKAYILKFIMDNWRLVKIGTTQAQRKLFYNLNKEKQNLEKLGFQPDEEMLSKRLDVSKEDIVEMTQRLSHEDVSLDTPFVEDSSMTRLDMLPALEGSVESHLARQEIKEHIRKNLKSIIPKLNEKEKDILFLRLLAPSPKTLREIGEKYGITRERVRQIESRLLEKLKEHFSANIQDFSPQWISDE